MDRLKLCCSAVVLAATLGGCASHQGRGMGMGMGGGDRTAQLEAELSAAQAERARLAQENEALTARMLASPGAPADQYAATSANMSLLPPKAKPGECYSRVTIPAQYATKTEQVLKSGASERVEIIPAKYGWVEETVMVTPATEKVIEVIPASYRTVEERVMVKPPSETIVAVPATYRTETEQQLVSAATTMWKAGVSEPGAPTKMSESGEIMCLVEVPAVYRTVTRKVVDTPATTKTVTIPAEYTTVKRKELVKEASVRKEVIPAVYKTVKVQKLLSPAQTRRIPIEAEYQTVTRQEKVSDAKVEWSRVVCKANSDTQLIRSVQQALQKAGHHPGPIDGRLGAQTLSAVRSFEHSNGLAIGSSGAIPYTTLEALGLGV